MFIMLAKRVYVHDVMKEGGGGLKVWRKCGWALKLVLVYFTGIVSGY